MGENLKVVSLMQRMLLSREERLQWPSLKKIKDLEAELASTQSKTGEASKAFQRAERKAKELAFARGEDRKNQDRMSELASKLQGKIKTYKQQIEEAEEIAALNLAKFRKAQQELEETEERAKLAMVL